ncbi:MAG: hypothetical protein JWO83_3750 [Caulobacteraceae bacterium]|nr:hypothetical protein [Caulobacteraceae bacterium]
MVYLTNVSLRSREAIQGWRLKVLIGCALAALIAYVAPFDLAFASLTAGSPVARACVIVILALAGVWLGPRIGLQIEPRGLSRPFLVPVAVAAAVAAYCAICDCAMRPQLSPEFLAGMKSPVVWRIGAFAARAFNENIIYRLFLGTALVWAIGRVWKDSAGGPSLGAYLTGFTLAQIINIWINVSALAPLTPLHLAHDALRYVVPGVVWSWLYWRYGFQSNEIACTSVHLFLQPLVTLGLGA